MIVVRDPSGKPKDQAFFTRDLLSSSSATLVEYASRWSIEVAFQNTKSRFGFEGSPELDAKSSRANGAPPIAMPLYSLLIAWFSERVHKKCKFPKCPWYLQKATPALSDILATVCEYFFNTPEWD